MVFVLTMTLTQSHTLGLFKSVISAVSKPWLQNTSQQRLIQWPVFQDQSQYELKPLRFFLCHPHSVYSSCCVLEFVSCVKTMLNNTRSSSEQQCSSGDCSVISPVLLVYNYMIPKQSLPQIEVNRGLNQFVKFPRTS